MLLPCLFNLYAEYILWNARLDESQAGIKISGRNSYNLRYANNTTLMAKSEQELKSLLIIMKEENEKTGLKLTQHSKNKDHGFQSHHLLANRRGKSGRLDRFYFLGSKNHWGQWRQPWN